ncbi:hypothetical protein FALBO_9894 [Fusarium albosuccineum]|uniref:NmrA-like domain-containing protein n=1 Tax=Fusarium albosuccineum TaxID=1237068 RepID=A0A8H4L8T7_9HYPO|nr:hypothetical protein FALBO_9894 [Fusarium albosuccineum]
MSSSINKVLALGASGNVGRSTLKALLEEQFVVSGLTRESSKATLPAGIKHLKSDYTSTSLIEAFKGQDAVISTLSGLLPGDALSLQKTFVDAAIVASVKIFVPSEFGIDTSDHAAADVIPFLADKIKTLDYLKANEDSISWISVVSGSMSDWGFNIPSMGGWDLGARTVTLFDGGDIPFEATNLDQVGRAIAKSLKKPNITKNQYVYVNSFTVTQNQILAALERATDDKFTISHSTVDELWNSGAAKIKEGQPFGTLAQISAAIYGKGGLANYSVSRGLWNDKIGLEQENLDEAVDAIVVGR